MADNQTEIQFLERDQVLDAYQRRDLVRFLAYEMYVCYVTTGEPISANDCRQMVAGIDVGDKRLFGGVLHRSKWEQVGWTNVRGPGHARRIGTFRPKAGVEWTPVTKPSWLKEIV